MHVWSPSAGMNANCEIAIACGDPPEGFTLFCSAFLGISLIPLSHFGEYFKIYCFSPRVVAVRQKHTLTYTQTHTYIASSLIYPPEKAPSAAAPAQKVYYWGRCERRRTDKSAHGISLPQTQFTYTVWQLALYPTTNLLASKTLYITSCERGTEW